VKVVEFTPTSVKGMLNLGFGDMISDGTISDTSVSNNDDIVKVLATVVEIINDFTTEYPDVKIVFTGNTLTKTSLYRRILRMYYVSFSKNFIITALVRQGTGFAEKIFDPVSNEKYAAFLVKRKL
jgi:hypothetical protein